MQDYLAGMVKINAEIMKHEATTQLIKGIPTLVLGIPLKTFGILALALGITLIAFGSQAMALGILIMVFSIPSLAKGIP